MFEDDFPIEKESLRLFLSKTTKHTKFEIFERSFKFSKGLITKPESFKQIQTKFKDKIKSYDKIFCFTKHQYIDNYFFHENNDISIFSFYAWEYLTNLPFSNGVVYFIIGYLALELDGSTRHNGITGCTYAFLGDKKGIDDGMRQSRFCPNCLDRLSKLLSDKADLLLFEDLKTLMNSLSDSSKWNNDVLAKLKIGNTATSKRGSKSGKDISVVIASPGDTASERKMLLDFLERRFRTDGRESHCGWRVIVHGWEDLPSQPGYPQDTINETIIQKSDFVVAIFKYKLGTPTKNVQTGAERAESGTVEELLQTLDNTQSDHPIGMAYFYSKAPTMPVDSPELETVSKEWKRLEAFKNTIKDKMIYKPYTDEEDLLSIVLGDLEKNIIKYIHKKHI